jgi:hypothetical protein
MILSYLRRVVICLSLLASTLPASATSTGIDYTDQWWGGQAESGWGVNFIEQGTTIFATLFVYGSDQTPRWYVATMDPTNVATTFTGTLYSTTGPWFGAANFDPHAVQPNAVGTMTVAFSSAYSGALNYIVNGVSVNKTVVRQTFKANNLAGTYMGGLAAAATNCHNGVTNGAAFMNGGVVVTQTGQNVSMAVSFYNGAGIATLCNFTGVLGAQGVMGQVTNGTFSCNAGGTTSNTGTFNLDTMTMTTTGYSGVFTGSDQFCTYNGYFGGIKQPT